MTSENIPEQSTKSLLGACLVAGLLAITLLLTAVLPAEYGIDPTGLGEKMGLLTLAKSSADCNKPVAALPENPPKPTNNTTVSDNRPLDPSKPVQWRDSVDIVIPANKGLEYKFAMKQGAALYYSWQKGGDSSPIYFDFHGEPKGATDGYFKSYLETNASQSEGVLTAPFEGIHGWYWENKTSQPVTIRLRTTGEYEILGIMK